MPGSECELAVVTSGIERVRESYVSWTRGPALLEGLLAEGLLL